MILIEPATRGNPMSPLRWTCKSTAKLAGALTVQGWPVSASTVGRLLHGTRLSAARAAEGPRRHRAPGPHRAIRASQRDGRHVHAASATRESLSTPRRRNWSGISRMQGENGSPRGARSGYGCMISPATRRARPFRTACTTWRGNEAWVSVGRDPRYARVRGRVDPPVVDDDGTRGVPRRRPLHHGRCRRAATAIARAGGRPPCHSWPTTSACASMSRISRRARASETRLHTGSSATSPKTGAAVRSAPSRRSSTSSAIRARPPACASRPSLINGATRTGLVVTTAEMRRLALHPHPFHGDWNYELRPRPS